MKQRFKYPSVTEVLGIFTDWSMVPADVMQRAQIRGQVAHLACGAYAKGIWMPALPERFHGYFESYKKWHDAHVIQVLAVETRLINTVHGYCGKADLLALTDLHDLPCTFDIKTPVAKAKTWGAQLSAYRELSLPTVRQGPPASIRIREDGSMPLINWVENPDTAYAFFISALNCVKYFC